MDILRLTTVAPVRTILLSVADAQRLQVSRPATFDEKRQYHPSNRKVPQAPYLS
jgi:hypothetical protein